MRGAKPDPWLMSDEPSAWNSGSLYIISSLEGASRPLLDRLRPLGPVDFRPTPLPAARPRRRRYPIDRTLSLS